MRPVLLLLIALARSAGAQPPPLQDLLRDHVDRRWVYDDLDRGIAQARETGKPLLVVFRCVP